MNASYLRKPPNIAKRILPILKRVRPKEELLREMKLDYIREYIEEHKDTLLKPEEFVETVMEPKVINHVTAVTGDDKIMLTNSLPYAVGPQAYASKVLGIKISYADCGVSQDVGNFAEEWILMPMNRASGWSGTRTGRGSKGIPWVLDAVKLRSISAVRKQSEEDMDLASKFRGLAVGANWVHPDWISYTDHQLALVLGLTLFDFRNERDFPFLMKSEGGCGGRPPYGVAETTRNTLWHFNKGRSAKPIIGIMNEAIKANEGMITNQNLMMLRAVHLATHSPSRWVEFASRIKEAKRNGYNEKQLAEAMTVFVEDEELPPELDEKAISVAPTNTFVGGVISALRQENYLMTELDVRVHQLAEKRIQAIKGDESYKSVNEKHRSAVEQAKKQNYSCLDALWEIDKDQRDAIGVCLDNIPPLNSEMLLDLIDQYYKTAEYTNHSSLSYQPYLKIFRRSDIIEHFDCGARKILAESLHPGRTFEYDYSRDKSTFNADQVERDKKITSWLNADGTWIDEDSLLRTIPISIGVTDPLIYGKVFQINAEAEEEKRSSVIVVITDDKRVANKVKAISDRVVVISPIHYYCWLRGQFHTGSKRVASKFALSSTPLPSLFPDRKAFLPEMVSRWLWQWFSDPSRNEEFMDVSFILDVPNILGVVGDRITNGTLYDKSVVEGWVRPSDIQTDGTYQYFSQSFEEIRIKMSVAKKTWERNLLRNLMS